jgi:hypothetical protein
MHLTFTGPRGGLALAAVLLAAGCSSGQPAPRAEAAAWMAAHPAPARPGLVNVMILPGGFAGAAAAQACPGLRLTAWRVPAAGDLPGCGAWTATALTVTGQVVRLACGSIPARRECPLFRGPAAHGGLDADLAEAFPAPDAIDGGEQP